MESAGVGRDATVDVDVENESIQIDPGSAVRYPAPLYPRGASSAFSVSVESWTVIPTSSSGPRLSSLLEPARTLYSLLSTQYSVLSAPHSISQPHDRQRTVGLMQAGTSASHQASQESGSISTSSRLTFVFQLPAPELVASGF